MPTRRILVADDEKNIRLTLADLLEGMGFEVVTAINGWEAVFEARKPHPSGPFWLVLLDYQMPGMDGLEALYSIRQDAPETRVAMITAHGSVATAVDAMKFGAVDFLSKPFVPSDIRALVHQIEARDAGPASAAPAEAPPDAA